MIDVLAQFAQGLFIFATAAQAYKCYKEGHAKGISHLLLWSLMVGYLIMLVYVQMQIGGDWILFGGYLGQMLMFGIIGMYKYYPRPEITPYTLKADKRYRVNKEILAELAQYIEKAPQQRFGQILRNMGFFKNERNLGLHYSDVFYEEPTKTLERIQNHEK